MNKNKKSNTQINEVSETEYEPYDDLPIKETITIPIIRQNLDSTKEVLLEEPTSVGQNKEAREPMVIDRSKADKVVRVKSISIQLSHLGPDLNLEQLSSKLYSYSNNQIKINDRILKVGSFFILKKNSTELCFLIQFNDKNPTMRQAYLNSLYTGFFSDFGLENDYDIHRYTKDSIYKLLAELSWEGYKFLTEPIFNNKVKEV